ncbi:NAD(P)-binding domain-containing protein [Ketogulonicigenium vulgare]|uniref:NAD(P)-binding domain-containing protein n=1 Tax=Ketogulonicigenium vulgare TaxID=92945 RepID=UPI003B5A6B07
MMRDISLAALEARLAQDLDRLNFTGKDWVPPTVIDGARVRDVVVIGAGMCGLVTSVALQKHGILNHVVYDKAPAGLEGPWLTIARMETLRSPKQLTGPAYGLPSLTFRAWYEASYGTEAWDALFRISLEDWMAYLVWYRRVMHVPVVNGAEMTGVSAGPDGLVALDMVIDGVQTQVLTRKLVLATGRDGLGGPFLPQVARDLPASLRAHSADIIDFDALRGKVVGVVGAGASAMDNAATALEHGAKAVHMFIRRTDIPRLNKGMGIGSPGMTHGYLDLDDMWKWRIQHHLNTSQTPPPRPSTLRVSRHANAYFHLGAPLTSLREDAGRLSLDTPKGHFDLDFMIFATGFGVDYTQRPELAAVTPHIKLWSDTGFPDTLPADLKDNALASAPDLGPAFELREKTPGACPILNSIYSFNFPSTLTHGKLSGDIPAVSEGADRLVRGITSALFTADIEQHWTLLETYATPELLGDEWQDADTKEAP